MKFFKIKVYIKTSCILLSGLLFIACGSLKNGTQSLTVTAINSSAIDKKSETIEIAWEKLKGLTAEKIIVTYKDAGKETPSQVIFNGKSEPQSVIFQTDINAGGTQQFVISNGIPTDYPRKVFGRQVPERYNDFAWENDRVAFRMYGEALEGKKGMAKGIDFWAKRTSKLVVNEWYKSGNYHKDNGDGVDAYHVGMTLGAGNAEPIIAGEIIYPINYTDYKILDNGPIRITFQLIYKPFLINDKTIKEVKTISLDAGSQMNMITNSYETSTHLDIAAGVTKHNGDGIGKVDAQNNFIAYWDSADGDNVNGFMGVGIVYPAKKLKEIKETKQHILAIIDGGKEREITYFQGGGWSKSGNFNSAESWFAYLFNFSTNLKNPLTIQID